MVDLPSYNTLKSDTQGIVVEYNTVIKKFSDGTSHIRYSSYSNLKGQSRDSIHNGSSTKEELERYNTINLIRRRQSISDLAHENGCVIPWEYFVTLTFDDEFVEDNYSHEKVTKYLTRWLNNQKHQNPNMRYILVPELCESGVIHFHGVFSLVPKWELEQGRSAKTGRLIYKNGSPIYNLKNYKLGFTTVSKVKNLEAVSHYISKYITKELLNLKNKKNVWHSRNLVKPNQSYHLADKELINEYIINNELNINFESNKTTDNYEKMYIATSSYNVY